MSFTETTTTSWLSRMKGAVGRIFFGIILVIATTVLLFWNEGRAIKTYRALVEGAGLVVSVDSASVDSASTIPNTDARNIPLRVELKQGSQSWKDEVLMVREGQCWAVDDVRYLGSNTHAPAGSLRQSLEKR